MVSDNRIESLVGWFFTGGILICVGLFMLIKAWWAVHERDPFVHFGGRAADSHIVFGGSVLLIVIGVVLIGRAIVGKLLSKR